MSLEEACDIGLLFKQDGIFYISAGGLSVSYCDHRWRLVPIGLFLERLDPLSRPASTARPKRITPRFPHGDGGKPAYATARSICWRCGATWWQDGGDCPECRVPLTPLEA